MDKHEILYHLEAGRKLTQRNWSSNHYIYLDPKTKRCVHSDPGTYFTKEDLDCGIWELVEENSNGLLEKEHMALNCLANAYNHFSELESTHPNDLSDFADAIHIAQRIIGMRCLRRDYPNLWISKGESE